MKDIELGFLLTQYKVSDFNLILNKKLILLLYKMKGSRQPVPIAEE